MNFVGQLKHNAGEVEICRCLSSVKMNGKAYISHGYLYAPFENSRQTAISVELFH